MDKTREFLTRVQAWPGGGEPGHIGLWTQGKLQDGKPYWSGQPCRTVEQLEEAVRIALNWPHAPDIYMCMSRQSVTFVNKKGKLRARKSQEAALALKSIFLDLDVKENAYPDLRTALRAVLTFCKDVELPEPTALVASGGGLHCHWISNKPLPPMIWKGYAAGLKALAQSAGLLCDLGVTIDSARVLRVPGTWNLKLDQRRPVTLLDLKENDYDFETDLVALTNACPPMPTESVSVLAGGPSEAFKDVAVESLGAGVECGDRNLISLARTTEACPHFYEALSTGGREFPQPLWHLDILAATFMENGHAVAHDLSKGHAGYSAAETDEMWERKQADREDNPKLGWPKCSTFQTAGCNHCAACPNLALGKSPLHFARVPEPDGQASVSASVGSITAEVAGIERTFVPLQDHDLPPDYVIREGVVCHEKGVYKDGERVDAIYTPLLYNKIYDPSATSMEFSFIAQLSKDTYGACTVPMIKMAANEIGTHLLSQACKPRGNGALLGELMKSWIHKLHEEAAARAAVPFGWCYGDSGKITGFAYGGAVYHNDGKITTVSMPDKHTREVYTPTGTPKHWEKVWATIQAQQKPELEAIVALSFGSPLMISTGEHMSIMSIWGDSGSFKSTAMKVGLAVWANPRIAKENEGATEKSVYERLGAIRNLPYMWDEIKNEDAQDKVYNLIYRSDGRSNSRLNADITQRKVTTWDSMVAIAANRSFVDYVARKDTSTTAGLVRVMEWHVTKPAAGALGVRKSSSSVARMVADLESNFGHMGKRWAQYLGTHHATVHDRVVANSTMFEEALHDPNINTSDERFWIASCAAILTGAELANECLYIGFNTAALKVFLINTVKEQRRNIREDSVLAGSPRWTWDHLTGFLKAYRRNRLMVGAGKFPRVQTVMGNPKHSPIEIIAQPETGCALQVVWDRRVNELVMSKKAMDNYMNGPPDRKGYSRGEGQFMRAALMKHFDAKSTSRTLGRGTPFAETPEICYVIPVVKDTQLWQALYQTGIDMEVKDDTGRQDQGENK